MLPYQPGVRKPLEAGSALEYPTIHGQLLKQSQKAGVSLMASLMAGALSLKTAGSALTGSLMASLMVGALSLKTAGSALTGSLMASLMAGALSLKTTGSALTGPCWEVQGWKEICWTPGCCFNIKAILQGVWITIRKIGSCDTLTLIMGIPDSRHLYNEYSQKFPWVLTKTSNTVWHHYATMTKLQQNQSLSKVCKNIFHLSDKCQASYTFFLNQIWLKLSVILQNMHDISGIFHKHITKTLLHLNT